MAGDLCSKRVLKMHQSTSFRTLSSSNASHVKIRSQGCSARAVHHQHHQHQVAAPDRPTVTDSNAPSTSGRQPLEHEYVQAMYRHPNLPASRRQLLLTLGTAASLAASWQLPSAAAEAAGGSCQLQQSSTGLQWCDLTVGEGNAPIKSAFTKVNYTAKLASTGAVFDSTYQRRQPLIFKVGECEMVQAFDVAILGAEDIPAMREGGKRLVVAPPGPMQRQGVKSLTWVTGLLDAIDEAGEPRTSEGGFNSTLVFELELVPKRRSRE